MRLPPHILAWKVPMKQTTTHSVKCYNHNRRMALCIFVQPPKFYKAGHAPNKMDYLFDEIND